MKSLSLIPIKRFPLKANPGSNLNLQAIFYNATLNGINDLRAYTVSGFGRNIEGPHEISFRTPSMGIMGSYKAKGQIAMFPIESQGEGSVNFSKYKFIVFNNL